MRVFHLISLSILLASIKAFHPLTSHGDKDFSIQRVRSRHPSRFLSALRNPGDPPKESNLKWLKEEFNLPEAWLDSIRRRSADSPIHYIENIPRSELMSRVENLKNLTLTHKELAKIIQLQPNLLQYRRETISTNFERDF